MLIPVRDCLSCDYGIVALVGAGEASGSQTVLAR